MFLIKYLKKVFGNKKIIVLLHPQKSGSAFSRDYIKEERGNLKD
jgi:hypothetical protein